MILALFGALAIGLSLGLLGSGGSILTVPVLVYLLGQEEKVAIAGSLAIVGTIALVGAIPYMFKKLVDWQNVLWFGIPGMIGTYLGAYASQFIPGVAQLTLFAIIMLVAAYKMISSPLTDNQKFVERSPIKISIDGLIVGVVTGIVGVGGGFLIVPALVLLGGLSMRHAVATSLVIIALKSYSGFYKYLDVLETQGLALDWSAIYLISAVGILGSFVGNAISSKLPQQKLKRFFGGFLVVMAIFILIKTAPGLW
ncbi:sulfite exporter TauE/SafE family protein [Alteromonadaceae bacterium M269]|nr:sulfite exporter TauE/SafE family protein [Alteromonadaceae bacterium M269]